MRDGEPYGRIEDGDSVIFFNFRADRARQLTRALVGPEFDAFSRHRLTDLYVVTMTEYDPEFELPVAFETAPGGD